MVQNFHVSLPCCHHWSLGALVSVAPIRTPRPDSLPRLAWPLLIGAFLGNAGIAAAESCGALWRGRCLGEASTSYERGWYSHGKSPSLRPLSQLSQLSIGHFWIFLIVFQTSTDHFYKVGPPFLIVWVVEHNSNIKMVYGMQTTTVLMGFITQFITGEPHIVWLGVPTRWYPQTYKSQLDVTSYFSIFFQGLVNVQDLGHHLQIFFGDYIPFGVLEYQSLDPSPSSPYQIEAVYCRSGLDGWVIWRTQ